MEPDEDLTAFTVSQLIEEVKKLRNAIRASRQQRTRFMRIIRSCGTCCRKKEIQK
ncbi:MAG TPA: hypothetical protein VGB50_03580 [Flavobacterium sp.]|jgi:hypothetical protein